MDHRISSPYHPQTNGLDERMNQTLVHALNKLTTEEGQWDQFIDAALYAYRISIQDSSRFSPFVLLYNRQPRKAIDHELVSANPTSPTSSDDGSSSDEIVAQMLAVRKEYHQKAYANIKRAQERQKEYFDAKHDSNHVRSVYVYIVYKNCQVQYLSEYPSVPISYTYLILLDLTFSG